MLCGPSGHLSVVVNVNRVNRVYVWYVQLVLVFYVTVIFMCLYQINEFSKVEIFSLVSWAWQNLQQ